MFLTRFMTFLTVLGGSILKSIWWSLSVSATTASISLQNESFIISLLSLSLKKSKNQNFEFFSLRKKNGFLHSVCSAVKYGSCETRERRCVCEYTQEHFYGLWRVKIIIIVVKFIYDILIERERHTRSSGTTALLLS